MKNPGYKIGLALIVTGFLMSTTSYFSIPVSLCFALPGMGLVILYSANLLIKFVTIVIPIILWVPVGLYFLDKLPFEITNHQDIVKGNSIVEKIDKYYLSKHQLPLDSDSTLHKELGMVMSYNNEQPQYKKLSNNTYKLTFVYGFDGPYLTYRSTSKAWNMEFDDPN